MVTGNLNWASASGAVSYKVEYRISGAGSWTLFDAAVTSTSLSIPSLHEGTIYDFRVTSNCASGASSPVIITQPTPCKNVEGLVANFVGTSVTLNWTKKPYAVSYEVEYKLQSSGTYLVATGSPLSNSGATDPVAITVPGLTSGSAYDFRVTVNCLEGTSTGSVVSATSTCIAPTSLVVTFV